MMKLGKILRYRLEELVEFRVLGPARLPSGVTLKAGEEVILRKLDSCWKSDADVPFGVGEEMRLILAADLAIGEQITEQDSFDKVTGRILRVFPYKNGTFLVKTRKSRYQLIKIS